MTDRELLEAAAKAAGIEILRSRLDDPLFRDMLLPATEGRGNGWNPLTDDGDALRLAVQLRLEITWWKQGVRAEPAQGRESVQPFGEDPYAATRRAIVRAAAAMVKP
jgi:hypothetical protein